MNPERLTARGPKAREDRKKEEQMQARVKSLDKLNKELTQQINAWEETNQGPFMFAGEKYKERMTNQDKEYTEYRDSLRNARKKKDGKHELAAAAERAKELAERELEDQKSEMDYSLATAQLAEAAARLKALQKLRKK